MSGGGDSLLFTFLGINRVSPAVKEAGDDTDRFAKRLDSFGKVGIKAFGGVAAAGVAAGVAAGGAVAGITLLFAGLAAVILAGNSDVSKSFSDLSHQVTRQMQAAAAPVVPYFQRVAQDLGQTANQLTPMLTRAFAASGPQLLTLTDGVSQFALNAMPGFLSAVNKSGPVMTGFKNLLASTGSGVSDFFEQLGRGSSDTGTVVTGFGQIVQAVLPGVAMLLTQLASTVAPHMNDLVAGVQNVVTIVTAASGGALPVFGAALGFVLNVLNGLAAVVGPMASALGGVTGVILSLAAAVKLMSTASGMITSVDAALGGLVTRFRGLDAAGGGFTKRAGALLGVLGGPLGAVIAAVTIGLGLLGVAQESTAQKTAAHTSYVDALTNSLRESSGAIDANSRRTVAQNKDVQEAITAAKEFGITQSQVVDAVLGQGNALDQLRPKLEKIIEASKVYATTETGDFAWTGAFNGQGQAAYELLNKINGLNNGTKEAQQGAKDYGHAMQSATRSMLETSSAGSKLSAAVLTLKDTASDAESRMRALKDIMDALSGDQLTLEEAQAKVNSQLINLNELAGSGTDRMQGWGNALVDANGKINTMLPNGQSLFGTLKSLRDESVGVAQATYDMAIAQGADVPTAMAKAAQSMQVTRDAVIKTATSMGISEDRAKALADQMGLVPSRVETAIVTPYMTESQRELAILKGRVEAVPGLKSIVVESLSEEAQRKLRDLGYQVSTLPNGKVKVESNTDPAWTGLRSFINAPATKYVDVIPRGVGAGSGGNYRYHDGGVHRFAEGGLFGRMRYFAAGAADVMEPNTWRITGDRTDVPESYIPWNNSPLSRSILGLTARALGFGLTPLGQNGPGMPVVLSRNGGMTVIINISGAQSPVATAEEIQRVLLKYKRDLGGQPLGID